MLTGRFVEEMESALVASALSNVHVMLIGDPGWGKTSTIFATARQMGLNLEKDFLFLQIDESTAPEKVEGMLDPAKALGNPPVFEIRREATAFDPNMHIVVADELSRGNNPVFSAMIHAMQRFDLPPDSAPTFWCTSNFFPREERIAALVDRIALWVWITPTQADMDAEQIVLSQLEALGSYPDLQNGIPSWERVARTRAFRPGANTARMVASTIAAIADEAVAGTEVDGKAYSFAVNPRRVSQWTKVLYRMSAYHNDSADFSKVPPSAISALRWAYPTKSVEEARAWASIIDAAGNPIAAIVEAIRGEAIAAYKEIMNDPSVRRHELSGRLGMVVTKSVDRMESHGASEEDYRDVVIELQNMMSRIVLGESPF